MTTLLVEYWATMGTMSCICYMKQVPGKHQILVQGTKKRGITRQGLCGCHWLQYSPCPLLLPPRQLPSLHVPHVQNAPLSLRMPTVIQLFQQQRCPQSTMFSAKPSAHMDCTDTIGCGYIPLSLAHDMLQSQCMYHLHTGSIFNTLYLP